MCVCVRACVCVCVCVHVHKCASVWQVCSVNMNTQVKLMFYMIVRHCLGGGFRCDLED